MSWGQGQKGLGALPVSPDWPASSRGSHMAGPMPAWSWGQRDLEALADHPYPPPHVQPRSCWMEPGGLGWAGLGAPREAGPTLGCPTRSSVSKRRRGAERLPAPLGKVVAGGFAQHSRALPPACHGV